MALPAMLALTTLAQAEEGERPGYDFIDIGYVYSQADIDSFSIRPNRTQYDMYFPYGLKVAGSIVLADRILWRGSYFGAGGDWKNSAYTSATTFTAGLGWLAPTSDATGIDVSFDYRRDSFAFDEKNPNVPKAANNWRETVDGPGFSVGLRAAPTDSTELGIRIGWFEGDYNGAIGIGVNLGWNISDTWGVQVGWDRMDADVNSRNLNSFTFDQYSLAGRFYF